MDPVLALASALTGYLLGSISFARIVGRLVAPDADVTRTQTVVDGTTYISDSVSATTVRERVGPRAGFVTGLLDMAKVALPVLVVAHLLPGGRYELILAGAAIVGHDFPAQHGFRGGRGETVLYGALLALDPLGIVAMVILGSLIGFAAGSLLVLRIAGASLMLPWFLLVRGDPPAALYLVVALGVLLLATRSEFAYYRAVDRLATNEEAVGYEFGTGGALGRAMDRWSLRGRWRRVGD